MISITISVLALLLSLFTFYWVQLRVKHSLHLVRIDKPTEFQRPIFALVNSGTRDILITSITGGFIDATGQVKAYPAQRVQVGQQHSMLLSAGTSTQCNITFLEEPPKAFSVATGTLRDNSVPKVYDFVFEIEIHWVDSQAQSHSAKAQICKYGFVEGGGISSFSPLTQKHDLYK